MLPARLRPARSAWLLVGTEDAAHEAAHAGEQHAQLAGEVGATVELGVQAAVFGGDVGQQVSLGDVQGGGVG